jgi:uncharacterized protein YgiM (DUF1202 family)
MSCNILAQKKGILESPMIAHILKIASISTLSLALIGSPASVAHPSTNITTTTSVQDLSPQIDEMEPSQKPAPVYGEDEQVIEMNGIDSEAITELENEATDPNTVNASEEPDPGRELESSPGVGEPEGNLDQSEADADPQSGDISETPSDQEIISPEAAESLPPDPSTVQSHQSQESNEEQKSNETAGESGDATLAAITTPKETIDFVAAGVTWDSSTSEEITEVSLRVREQGDWSEWHQLEVHATEDEMRAHSPRAGTEPLITVEADAVQARVHTKSGNPPEELEVSLINPGESATDGQLEPASADGDDVENVADASTSSGIAPLDTGNYDSSQDNSSRTAHLTSASTALQSNRPSTNADVIKPAIVTRAQWGANESLVSTSNQSTDLKAMYIHHTAGTNNYTRAQAYAQVRSVFQYHTVSLRWGDIGYNFLIDRYGTIYEGRRGSLDSLPVGAQAGGFNTNTFGISTLGNFEKATPPASMVESLKRVLAWKGLQYGINATGKTRLRSAGGTSKYSNGTSVSVNTILGHKDTHATLCPGQQLYSQLPAIRKDVAKRIDNAKSTSSNYKQINSGLTYRAQQSTILRASPNSKSAIVQRLSHGTKVTTTNLATSGWWRVTANGKTGWVPPQHIVYHTRYIPSNYKQINAGLTYRAQQSTILRASPNSKSAIVQRLSHGTKVTTTNLATSGWWRVTANGKTGWVPPQHIVYHTRYIPSNYKQINAGLTYRAQQSTILRASPNSKSAIVQRLPHGTRVTTTCAGMLE